MPVSCVQFCVHLILSDYKSVNLSASSGGRGKPGSVRSAIRDATIGEFSLDRITTKRIRRIYIVYETVIRCAASASILFS